MNQEEIYEKTCAAIRNTLVSVGELSPGHSLVFDLGFDSMRMATLSIALEIEFDTVLLLNDWISSVDDPYQLTVRSLVEYLAGAFSGDGANAREFGYAVP
jgi:acyl carrier protein